MLTVDVKNAIGTEMMHIHKEKIEAIQAMAKRMRRKALDMAFAAGHSGSHLGPGLSMIELVAALYGGIMKIDPKNPASPNRDRFFLSKGHGVLAYYTALGEVGYLTEAELNGFETDGAPLGGHPVINLEKGVESSSGSLGMGLSLALGSALAGKRAGKDYCVFTLLGDGECGEGAVWEAAMAAAHYQLDNLIAIIDHNNLQYDGRPSEVMDLGDFVGKWESFGWKAIEVDGHDIKDICDAFVVARQTVIPTVIIAHTVKGKGISFVEDCREWHHGVLSKTQYELAMSELEDELPSEKG